MKSPTKTLDDKIRKGIDGIYRNTTPPPKFVIDEAKYGSSKLSKLKDGTRQMSDNWIMDRLNHLDRKARDDILKAIERKEIDRVLSKVDQFGNVNTFKLNSLGKNIGKWP
ncbi:hypothetical protein RO21_08180 [[Actinobacillus] muris]|uniref:Uncharacterized protein n=1 Tax=Muribacter muris TaxID=67855 RepID=A0A0J5P472_9PAST|nr:hypothetical protein [Muribacter muris]KMK51096.1 hypothetical protein RO21_08180 [[Actinobacillus] muris] [Muribacter muris]